MWQWLKNSKRIYHNPKTILRVMKKYGLLAEIRRHRNGSRWAGRCTNTRIFSTKTFTPKHQTANG